MAKDYYKILGVDKSASSEDIKKAFRKLAHQHHPDKASGDEAKFKEINEAYQVLSDQKKRQQYDQFGQTFDQAGTGGFEGFSDFFNRGGNANNGGFSFEFGDMGDVFGDLFGFGGSKNRGRSRQQVGHDIETELTITFKEAIFGTQKTVTLNKDEVCSKCGGNGIEPGAKILTCPECHGTGQILKSMGFGISFGATCPTCKGTGQKGEKDCSQCHGSGVNRTEKKLTVKIPAGIDNGQSIRLTGEGQATRKGGRSGDLYIRIRVTPDKIFVREGDDILTQHQIAFSQATLGGKIEVETIDGPLTLKIPAGTTSGKIFRLASRGVQHVSGRGRGDQLVKVVIRVPERLSRRQKELLEDLSREGI